MAATAARREQGVNRASTGHHEIAPDESNAAPPRHNHGKFRVKPRPDGCDATPARRSGEIIELGGPPPYDRAKWLCDRLLGLVDESGGVCVWNQLRTRVGGRYTQAEFVAAIDDLLACGVLLEARLTMGGKRTPGHVLVRPGRGVTLGRPVQEVRGTAAAIEREEWGRDLMRRQAGATPGPNRSQTAARPQPDRG